MSGLEDFGSPDIYSSEVIFDDTFFTAVNWSVHCIVEYILLSSGESVYMLTMKWTGKQHMTRTYVVNDNPDEVSMLHISMIEQILLTQGQHPYPAIPSRLMFENLPEDHRFF